MITLAQVLRGYDPKGGRPVPIERVYMANLMAKDEARRRQLQQQRDDFTARRRERERVRMDIAAMLRGEEPRGGCARGVPEAASQLAQQSMPFPQAGRRNETDGREDGAKNI